MGRSKGRKASQPPRWLPKWVVKFWACSVGFYRCIMAWGARHPLRAGIYSGAFLMVALLALGPKIVTRLSGGGDDWFSFWTGWIPGVCSVGLAFSSIFITVSIARTQTKQSEFLNEMQTRLTLAMNLPCLQVDDVEFYSKEECARDSGGVDRLHMGRMLYRFILFFPADALPANYRVVLEGVSWKFPDLPKSWGDEVPQGQLEPGNFIWRIFRNSGKALLRLDFWCPEQERAWFTRFFRYPKFHGQGEDCVELTLQLRLENLLLDAVMGAKAGSGTDGYNGRLDLYLRLYCGDELPGGAGPHSPEIFVADHSISVPSREA